MNLSWRMLNIEIPNRNANITNSYVELVKANSGMLKSGQMLAIMGPSGCGKSTILNALAGRIPSGSKTQGEILYNDKPRKKHQWFKKIGFVEQDDRCYENLTIEETLSYAADLKLKDKSELNIQGLLKELNLHTVSKNLLCNVSGGERRRTMIGVELITDPEILFLDEPTSGLDTLVSKKICMILKELAVKKNKIIILTIHSPSTEVFYLFDQIMLLSKGSVIYYGDVQNMEGYFKEKHLEKRELITFPEFIIEISGEDFKNEHPELFYSENSVFKEKVVVKNNSIIKSENDLFLSYKPNLYHISLLMKRKFKMSISKKMSFVKAFGSKFLFYIIVVLLTYLLNRILDDNREKTIPHYKILSKELTFNPSLLKELVFIYKKQFHLMFILFTIIFMQVFTVSCSFYTDEKIVKKELSSKSYSLSSYYIAFLTYQIIFECIISGLTYILFISLVRIASFYIFLVFIITPLVTVPLGFCIGSFTTNGAASMVLSAFFGLLAAFPPLFIVAIVENYGLNGIHERNIISFLTYFSLIFPTIHYAAILPYAQLNHQISKIKNQFETVLLSKIMEHKITEFLSYINYYEHSSVMIVFLLIFGVCLSFFVGLFMFGVNLMPNIRMNLQRKQKTVKN